MAARVSFNRSVLQVTSAFSSGSALMLPHVPVSYTHLMRSIPSPELSVRIVTSFKLYAMEPIPFQAPLIFV